MKMKKVFLISFLFILTCGPSENQIQNQIDDAVQKALETSTSTSLTSTTLPTTTSSTTTPITTVAQTTTTIKKNITSFFASSVSAYEDSFDTQNNFYRWKMSLVIISIDGNPSVIQKDTFNYVVGDLNRLIDDVQFKVVENYENPDINIYFGNKETWSSKIPGCDKNKSRVDSAFEYLLDSNQITNGYICLPNEIEYQSILDATESEAQSCAIYDIRTEMSFLVTGSMMAASYDKYGPGVFSSKYCDTGNSYTSIDEDIIKIHYDSRVKEVKTINEVISTLKDFIVIDTTTSTTTSTTTTSTTTTTVYQQPYDGNIYLFTNLTGMENNPYLCERPGRGSRVGLSWGRCLPYSGTGPVPNFDSYSIPAWYDGSGFTTSDPYSSSGGSSGGYRDGTIINSGNECYLVQNGNLIPLQGTVQFVDFFPDFTVQIVDFFPDLNVQFVDFFATSCGEWQVVDFFPDFTVQIVDFFPDISISVVDFFPGTP